MKINKYIIGLGLTFSFLFAGCDSFLDPAKDGKLGEEDIWNETRRAFGFLNDAYNKLPSGYNYIDNAMLRIENATFAQIAPLLPDRKSVV